MTTNIPNPQNPVKLIYLLYIVGLFIPPIPQIIGVIIAYVNKGDTLGYLKSHYQFQIRTFWFGVVFFLSAVL